LCRNTNTRSFGAKIGRYLRTLLNSVEVASDACYWAVNDFKEGW
jgi:hypothetical protein